MKKMIIIPLLLTIAFAKAEDIKDIKKFYYELGKQEALKEIEKVKEEAYKKGFEDGIKYAKRILKRWAKRIYEYELGKYMIKEKLITYPRVYSIIKNNRVYYVVEPPKEEELKNVDKLLEKNIYIPKEEDE